MAVTLATAAWAYACVTIPSVTLSPGSGPVGTVVTGKAVGYSSDAMFSNIEVRWGGANGPMVAEGKPATGNTWNFTFKVPDATPGSYAVHVTQRDKEGAPAWGTPSRAVFSVPGATGTAPKDVAPEPEVIEIQQQHVVAPAAPAAQAPAAVMPIEARDAITTKVTPGDSRSATYDLLSNAQAPNSAPARVGLAVMAIGVMALISATAALVVVRSASKEASYR